MLRRVSVSHSHTQYNIEILNNQVQEDIIPVEDGRGHEGHVPGADAAEGPHAGAAAAAGAEADVSFSFRLLLLF